MILQKKTKIVCTIGPATWDPEVMRSLIEQGMNVARVNGAFADPDELDKVRNLVRNVSDKVSLMVDVKGPEVRMNKFPKPLKIQPGDKIEIGSTEDAEIYPANYIDVYKYIDAGQRVVVGDGDVELLVDKVEGGVMYTTVVFGEEIKPGKALNLPGASYSQEILTEKDRENLEHAMRTGWDMCSASFVQDAESAQYIKDFLRGSDMMLIAKIEDQEGVNNIDEILEVVDGVMIARGGLGVELGLENVPAVQRLLTRKCNEVGKPVITATQMLESMTYNPRPTRAEVNDVAFAVMLGSDAVMLSGESSAGEYPVEAVKTLSLIAQAAEKLVKPRVLSPEGMSSKTTDAFSRAIAEFCISLDSDIDKILVVTETGATARMITRHSVKQPVYAYTGTESVARTLMMTKGVVDTGVMRSTGNTLAEYVSSLVHAAIEDGFITKGEVVLVLSRDNIETETHYKNVFELIDTSKY